MEIRSDVRKKFFIQSTKRTWALGLKIHLASVLVRKEQNYVKNGVSNKRRAQDGRCRADPVAEGQLFSLAS